MQRDKFCVYLYLHKLFRMHKSFMLVYSQLCMRAKAVSCFRSECLCNDIIEAVSTACKCKKHAEQLLVRVVAVVLHCFICKDIMTRNTQSMLMMNSLTSILMLMHTNSKAVNDLTVLCMHTAVLLLDATISSHKLLVLTMTNISCVRSWDSRSINDWFDIMQALCMILAKHEAEFWWER